MLQQKKQGRCIALVESLFNMPGSKIENFCKVGYLNSFTYFMRFASPWWKLWAGVLSFVNVCLRSPIRNYVHYQIGIVRVIRFQMNAKVVRSIHAFMHHEDSRFDHSAFTRL
jgi:hypothetical protein